MISVGKVANSQVGVYLGYASRKGHSFLDARLFLPEQWFAETHQEKRQACGVPEELSCQTKPEIALELLETALERGELPVITLGPRTRRVPKRALIDYANRLLAGR